MKNIHLDVFEELKKQLLNFPRNTFYDHCLRIIVDAQLNKLKYSDEEFGFVNIYYLDGVIKNVMKSNEEVQEYISNGGVVEPAYTEEELRIKVINTQILEAKTYLTDTDFYMTVDKYAELDEARKVELTTKRAEARELINTLEAVLATLVGN